ncbi:MAG: alpha/beta hydrolase [Phycisphaerae bacterium]|nr:alpha/beta hydrolase [Gemmatimonadaceae bacterium]
MHVERVGRGGPPVVLLHGFGTCAFLWRAVAPRLANAGFTALSFDLMGYGESDRPESGSYGIVAQAEYVDRALTALRLPKALVVGQDVGAIVALQLAARRPERVDRLLLINPPNPADLPGPSIRAAQRAAARIALGVHGYFVTGQALTPFLRESVAHADHMSDLLVARYMAPYVGADGLSHLLLLARSLELEDEEALQLENVQAPVLVAIGEMDETVDRTMVNELVAELSAAELPPRIETVPGAGTLLAEDVPEALAELIRGWINVSVVPPVESVIPADEISLE